MAHIVLALDYELFESSHEVLNCLFALLKGEKAFLSIAPNVWWLECLLELVCKLVKGAYSIQPLSDIKVCPSSCSVLSFHIGQYDQHLLPIRRLIFKAGKVKFDCSPPLDILDPVTIIWVGLGGDRFANSDVRPS